MDDKNIKNQKIIKDMKIDSPEDQILSLLHKKLEKKYINIPNDQSIKILLQNEDIKNLISFTLNKHTEIEQELKIRKKVSFYFVNNQKIDEYIKLKSVQKEKNKKLNYCSKERRNLKRVKYPRKK